MSDTIAVSSAGDAQDLVRAKAVLLQSGDTKRRLSPEALRTALVDLHDFWLASRCAAIGLGERASLVAVGALGRRELAPWSDLDLVLLHDGRKDIDRIADQLWYPLWDAGIGLDHSVRTPGQAVQVAATDLRAAFGLLEIRHIAGDTALTDSVRASVRQAWRAGIRSRFDEIVESAHGRWRKVGDVAHRVEPDLKNGHGGLRDIQLVDALAAAQLVDRPAGDVPEAQRLLLDVRTELHRLAGRARDVLRAQDADEVAAVLELGDRFELARALSGAARAVAFSAETGLRSAKGALPRRGLAALRRSPVRRPLDSGVVEHAGEVALARDAAATRDPALVLRVAATAARTGLPVAAGTLHRLADTAPELREPWPRDALGELLSLLGTGRPLVDVVEALDRTGLWGRLFPEWGAVRDLPPRDRAHVWTVDRHLVESCAQVARLTTRVARPDLLLVGTLLHDIGKGRGGDHSVVGESLAVQVGRRLGFTEPDVAVLGAMVRHHLLLPHTATRRDLEDAATVTRVVETLQDAVGASAGLVLDLLTALAEADSLATGPGVWSPWKKTLIGDLSRRCRALIAGEPLPVPPADGDRELAAAVRADQRVQVRFVDEDTPATVVVAVPAAKGSLAAAAGVLALHSLEVHAAEVSTTGDVAVLRFTVSPRFGGLPDPALLRTDLGRVVDGSLVLAEALARKERDYAPTHSSEPVAPPRVLWFDDEATGAVVLELRGTDRIGLLHRVAAALEDCDAELRWARVATLGSSVVDSFSLGGPNGDGAIRTADRRRIERAVLAAVG
ncbi:[protein-PII] uridylyltransferase [Pseudonocardia hydrocarbonoxydans]|uniref:Bifunctional uridylyltransferase/uridylyl-removing enzyme n=1 Tax=Pseudonocardia hydrocarbonoxydans TaxID=76726 RepID=A0A4Y3WRW4_9PSEU|nr:[protein-PII] uridylyltransferase [Pseudonocardia hydrocarbonoxydans]GEC21021.1 bifunctional uridylyltransferase/uridylyl-removing enzyme [Pseudonocardia hydrocarbonoxydans]